LKGKLLKAGTSEGVEGLGQSKEEANFWGVIDYVHEGEGKEEEKKIPFLDFSFYF